MTNTSLQRVSCIHCFSQTEKAALHSGSLWEPQSFLEPFLGGYLAEVLVLEPILGGALARGSGRHALAIMILVWNVSWVESLARTDTWPGALEDISS